MEKIEQWKTKDGQIFASQKEAKEHESYLNFQKFRCNENLNSAFREMLSELDFIGYADNFLGCYFVKGNEVQEFLSSIKNCYTKYRISHDYLEPGYYFVALEHPENMLASYVNIYSCSEINKSLSDFLDILPK